jgi:tRNA-uridine 2-sulfurtransferase
MIKGIKEINKKTRVFVGLSGGVDSSVSASLLKEQGYDVTGVFIKVWQPDFWGGCTMVADRLDAMRVCAKLDIPFYTLDLEKEYKKEVVDYMINEYKAGRTPNPDVMCNKYVKFGGFFDWAMKNGADYVATGHYARILIQPKDKVKPSSDTDIFLLKNSSCSRQSRSQAPQKALPYLLVAGQDQNKDQSYFLWTLTQKQLAKTLFPVGDIEKPEVRKLAKKFDLPTAVKKDSQGLCFIGKVEMAEFLRHFIKSKDGAVLNVKGEKIGTHKGAVFYTIGQRHGFIIDHKNTSEQKSFAIAKNIKKNTITVSDHFLEEGNIKNNKEIYISHVNWTANPPIPEQIYEARIRYRGELYKCQIEIKNKKTKVIFKEEIKNCTPGQSIVFYDKNICLGGGIII